MKKIRITLTKTIFSRILLFNIIMIVSAVVIFQIVYYNYFRVLYDREFNELNMQNIRQVQRAIDESILVKVVDIPNRYFSDIYTNEDLVYPINNDITRDPLATLKVKKKLEDIRNTAGVVDSIDLFYKKSGIFFINGSIRFMFDGTFHESRYPHWFPGYESSKSNTVWLAGSHVSSSEEKDVITFVRSIPFFASKEEVQAVVAVNVEEKELLSYINDRQDPFIIIDSEGNIILHNNKENLPDKKDKSLMEVLSMEQDGYFVSNIKGQRSVVSFAKSNYCDWRYVSIMPLHVFYKKSYQVRNFLILGGLLLLAVYLAVSVLLTKRAHKPMATILKDVNRISKTMGSSTSNVENEYNLLSYTIKDLMFKVNDLTQKVESNKSIIYDNTVRQLLNGSISNVEEENLQGIRFEKEQFFCFVIKNFSSANISHENRQLISYNIIRLLESEHEKWDINAIFDDDINMITGIVNYDTGTETEEIEQFMVSVIETILNVKYVLCIGSRYAIRTEEVAKSYKEARRCLGYAFIHTGEKVLSYEKLCIGTLKRIGEQVKGFGKIEDYIRSGDEVKLIETIDNIAASFKTGEYRVSYCRNTLFGIVSTVRKTLNEIGYNDVELFGTDILEEYKRIENVDSFRMWIGDVVRHAIRCINEKRSNLDKEIEIRIKTIIEENIYKDISLELVADELNIRPDTLSKMFKTVTNLNFTDYVRNLKLHNATRLLEEGKMSVQEISNKLGYNATHYFIRIFKEKYGCTPKQYQKINTFSPHEK